jgi:hypothetical protein
MIIPTRDRPRLKYLLRLRQDLWGTVLQKKLLRKKWRDFLLRIRASQKRQARSHTKSKYSNFGVERLVNSKWYSPRKKYAYREGLVKQQAFKFYYGSLQDYKLKLIVARTRGRGWIGFAQNLEASVSTFLYNFKIVSTIGESRYHARKKRVLINGNPKIKHFYALGSVVNFPPYFRNFVRRRLHSQESILQAGRKEIKIFPSWVDFDSQSLRFIVYRPIQPISLPFFLDFKKIWRWYQH